MSAYMAQRNYSALKIMILSVTKKYLVQKVIFPVLQSTAFNVCCLQGLVNHLSNIYKDLLWNHFVSSSVAQGRDNLYQKFLTGTVLPYQVFETFPLSDLRLQWVTVKKSSFSM